MQCWRTYLRVCRICRAEGWLNKGAASQSGQPANVSGLVQPPPANGATKKQFNKIILEKQKMQHLQIHELMCNLTLSCAKPKPLKVSLMSPSAGDPDPVWGSSTILAQGCNWNEAPSAAEAVTCKDTRAVPFSTARPGRENSGFHF